LVGCTYEKWLGNRDGAVAEKASRRPKTGLSRPASGPQDPRLAAVVIPAGSPA
jgi:hypothetical protein